MNNENNSVAEENEQIWEKINAILGSRREPDTLKALLAEWEEIGPKFGPNYNERASKLVGHHTRVAWASIATKEKDNSIEDLLRMLWDGFRQVGGEFTVEKTGCLQIHREGILWVPLPLRDGPPHCGGVQPRDRFSPDEDPDGRSCRV
jgi:hypothetical protein